ncbi:MAG: hypothetical protein CME71_12735 [Halobacteriovorax sp.]|nr:hypothetical protein [Halobacteriovorax sp.]
MTLKIRKFVNLQQVSSILAKVEGDFKCGQSLYSESYFSYLESYYNETLIDHSFIIERDGDTIAAFLASGSNESGVMELYGQPCLCFMSGVKADRKLVATLFKDQLLSLCLKEKVKLSLFLNCDYLRYFLSDFLDFFSLIEYHYINLQLDNPITDVRKSYRSLINWGKRNLTTEVYGSHNCTVENVMRMRDFHISVAGRETRPKNTWIKQFESILREEAYMQLAYYDGELVGANLIESSKGDSYYSVGVYDRSLMKAGKAMTHFLLWSAVELSLEKNAKTFTLAFQSSRNELELKDETILSFKKGFCNSIDCRVAWIFSPR